MAHSMQPKPSSCSTYFTIEWSHQAKLCSWWTIIRQFLALFLWARLFMQFSRFSSSSSSSHRPASRRITRRLCFSSAQLLWGSTWRSKPQSRVCGSALRYITGSTMSVFTSFLPRRSSQSGLRSHKAYSTFLKRRSGCTSTLRLTSCSTLFSSVFHGQLECSLIRLLASSSSACIWAT